MMEVKFDNVMKLVMNKMQKFLHDELSDLFMLSNSDSLGIGDICLIVGAIMAHRLDIEIETDNEEIEDVLSDLKEIIEKSDHMMNKLYDIKTEKQSAHEKQTLIDVFTLGDETRYEA